MKQPHDARTEVNMRVCLSPLWVFVSAFGVMQTQTAQLSPAQRQIQWAQKAIEKNPDKYQPYNDLALGWARRASETSDTAYYQEAEEALRKSFQLAPGNFGAQKTEVLALLGKHEYAQARDKARVLNRRVPDDVLVYGYIADAAAELGDYGEAEKAAQWMLDLRPGNVPGLLCGARLRKLYGDVEGALDFLSQAYQELPPTEVADVARLLTQMGDLQLSRGEVEIADRLLGQALASFPGYYLATETRARVRTAQRKYGEAVELLQQRNQSSPSLESRYALAEALERAGRRDEAKAFYAEFEREAERGAEKAPNANRELIFYYADHTSNPAEALRIARLEVSRRHDVATLDAYAWALYASGNYREARMQIEKALTVGIRDAKFFYHAGMIDSKLNDQAAAGRFLKQSLELNPLSEVSGAAREALDRLAAGAALKSGDK